jgi:hypothetical protein
MSELMQRTLDRATAGTRPFTRARKRALAGVRWVLATNDSRFVAVDECGRARLTDRPAGAAVYDGRDNEELKVRFFTAILGERLTVVLLDP